MYQSKFGGLWFDDTDVTAVLRKVAAISDPALRDDVAHFIGQGYVIMRQAVSHDAIDAYLEQYEAATKVDGYLKIEGKPHFSKEWAAVPGAKVLDTGMQLPSGAALAFAPRIDAFLRTMFDGPAAAFQTLHFAVGSTQAIHQDTAYVVVDAEPMQLIAVWIALEDVEQGVGELLFYPGMHRIPEHLYADGTSKNWNVERDGHPIHDAHLTYLKQIAAERGVEAARFLPKKGDILFWHADLPHGGGEITRPGATRASMVVHYTPAANKPYYSHFIPEDWRAGYGLPDGNRFISLYFSPQRFQVKPEDFTG